jgi:hypothetical protein
LVAPLRPALARSFPEIIRSSACRGSFFTPLGW